MQMIRRNLIILVSILLSVVCFVGIFMSRLPYDIYTASTIISIEQPGSELQQQAVTPLFGGGQSKRITEFFEVINGVTIADHLIQFDFIRDEVDKWRHGQLAARVLKPQFEPVQIEDVRNFIMKSVSLDTLDQGGIVKLDLTTSDRTTGVKIINEILNYYIGWRRSDELALIKGQMETLSTDLEHLAAAQVSNAISSQLVRLMTREVIVRADLSYGLRIVDEVYAPRGAVNMSPVIMLIISIMIGVLVYYSLQFIKVLRAEIKKSLGGN
jgi:capsular polysaccharide biosynthesis protein